MELENIKVSSAQFEAKENVADDDDDDDHDDDDDDHDDDLDECGPEEEKMVELEQQNLPSDTGEGYIIIIEE